MPAVGVYRNRFSGQKLSDDNYYGVYTKRCRAIKKKRPQNEPTAFNHCIEKFYNLVSKEFFIDFSVDGSYRRHELFVRDFFGNRKKTINMVLIFKIASILVPGNVHRHCCAFYRLVSSTQAKHPSALVVSFTEICYFCYFN